MRRLFLILSVLCLLPVVSCAPVGSYREWTVDDLRLLDPVDNTPTPSTDILAVYTRNLGSDYEIRVDLLDLPLIPDYRLQVLLSSAPGGSPWTLSLDFPADATPTVTPAGSNLIPRLIRDPWLDTITIRLNRLALPPAFTLQVATFAPGNSTPEDETVPVRSDATPPIQRAPLVLAFWNAFPAATPAQALRRWDGAHTGPLGERHGLKHILDNAGKYAIPVALLDIKTPASLAALDHMGRISQVQNLADHNLLILPDVAYSEPTNISLAFSRLAAAGFGLPASQFVYGADSSLQPNYLAQFLPLENTTHVLRSGRTRLIPLPSADAVQATPDGPSLDVRRALVAELFSGDFSELVVLGGDLPASTWGNENMAAPTFAWIAAHPWIQPLNGNDLVTFPVQAAIKLPAPAVPASPILEALQASPQNSLTDSAWQTYLMLSAPTTDEKLAALRQNFLGQVYELLAGAAWADAPSAQANCDHDLNGDGQNECVLASLNIYAILDPSGARLTNLFSVDAAFTHQLVGPSSQFTVGLSDPSEWRPELGQAADPGVIPGAFSDATGTWLQYTPTITPEGISFSSPDGSLTKTYQILENGIRVTYQVSAPVSTRIPLVVDSQSFYFHPVPYTGSLVPGVWTWGQANGILVEVQSDAEISVESFTDSDLFLSQPENPDFSYPGGHYLPFPLSVVDINAIGNFSVQITVK